MTGQRPVNATPGTTGTEPAEAAVEAEQLRFRTSLDARMNDFLDRQRTVLADVSPDALELVEVIARLGSGGKRLRALLCYWGWRGAGGAPGDWRISTAGSALELFQAAALIHDDIIDRSDTRRGSPSVHRQFSSLHRHGRWHLDPERFGYAAAILAGDLCLAFSEEQFAEAADGDGGAARRIFNRMRTEVMAGQYLDLLEEAVGPDRTPEAAVTHAGTVLRYKSAKYSTEHPLALGGALAGASHDLLEAYSAFALPLGEAYQLRDDVLGVFGDPRRTGKPAGDDLREGKRTVLIAHALGGGTDEQRNCLNSGLGRPDLDEGGIEQLRNIIKATGALGHTEQLIEERRATAFTALAELPVDTACRSALSALAKAAVSRNS
jgi:geranylgeranyl diphosphate synthase type I